jgi:hypothetical protein
LGPRHCRRQQDMDKFTLVKKIGEGAYGKALLVRNNASQQQFVIKEVNLAKVLFLFFSLFFFFCFFFVC